MRRRDRSVSSGDGTVTGVPQRRRWDRLMPVTLAALGIAAWAFADYRAWMALGPGGLPGTWQGWWRTTRWRMMARSPFALGRLQAHFDDADNITVLGALAIRRGRRPRVGPHPVPHRQLDQHAPAAVKAALHRAFDAQVAAEPVQLIYARSHFEKHNEAVTLAPDRCRHADACATRGEIGHIHPSDGSMHVVLSPSDAVAVIERGWGELHGLAGLALDLPMTYTLIYAPRDLGEVATDAQILAAAVAYMAGTATTAGAGSTSPKISPDTPSAP